MSETYESTAKNRSPAAVSIVAVICMVVLMYVQGRVWWCKLGDYAIYVHEAWGSSHTSQHLLDPYTFTHILHGVLFFWLSGVLFKDLSMKWRYAVAICVEAAWEVLENSNYIIEKYRENTASLDYFGDSIVNSFGDVLACIAGFWIAAKLGWGRSLIFFLLVEFFLLIWIRDSLLLNILMLLWPFDGIKEWQMGA